MIVFKIDISSTVALISVIIAFLAMVSSFWSIYLSKKSLRLSIRQYNDKLPDFDLYFIQGYRFVVNDNSTMRRILLFQLTIRNKSQFRNTLRAELELEYLRDDSSISVLKLDHNPELISLLKKEQYSIFPINIAIKAKSTDTKYLIFEQPNYISKLHRIERYGLKLLDLNGNFELENVLLISEVEL